ncbi:ABC transporter substrate-binding protein [Mangrovibrevibacter kandeliae]|uniref:ABC transporter substrate-binding protein n=1 Tax=Mangrovibrevibacter kandeliae TaxID=2968473 RepID=UPI002118E9B5|nr:MULTISPECIES: ABC transporter substrate-binding protein [unclassified Aurantimonas]MCQ8783601.1 ABC transporter substrate-binding protein [Aurantimonas sp. CSK15Z-1]MCW4116439.1 ABC transporter substrate-binding protein [Aurantimonas sp. MSK8Z-1]
MKVLLRTALAAAMLTGGLASGASAAEELVIAEPVHSLGYLPMYVAIDKGYFAEEGIDASVLTVDGGGAHTNAVLTKQAFAFIGGPEHDAFAKAKGAELRAVVNVVNRGNVYLVSRKDVPGPADGQSMADYLKGKTIATGAFGGTPNSITRYILTVNHLDPKTDVVLQELATAGIMAALKTKQADIGVLSEPMLTQGIDEGLWNEPFYNVPKELGPYTYSTLNVRQESIENQPELVEGFVRAISRGLAFTHDNPEEATKVAAKEFPTMDKKAMKATLDRAFADNLWSADGNIEPEAWDTGKAVVMDAGILKQDVPYGDIIDMSFWKKMRSAD